MKKSIGLILVLLFLSACSESNTRKISHENTNQATIAESIASANDITSNDFLKFIPKNYILSEKIEADLNSDETKDCVLIIKGTDKTKIISDENHGQLDQNRRGIIVLFKNKDKYELAAKNYNCFSSENEDGGVYFPPELQITSEDGKLNINYGHGRYGNWNYIFRYRSGKFELVEYNQNEDSGPINNSVTRINFLARTKLVKTNINEHAKGGDEIYTDSVITLTNKPLINLENIRNFDELEISEVYN